MMGGGLFMDIAQGRNVRAEQLWPAMYRGKLVETLASPARGCSFWIDPRTDRSGKWARPLGDRCQQFPSGPGFAGGHGYVLTGETVFTVLHRMPPRMRDRSLANKCRAPTSKYRPRAAGNLCVASAVPANDRP